MTMSNYLSEKLLSHTLRNIAYTPPATVYVALFTVIPDAANAGGTEVTGGSYARRPVAFLAPAAGTTYNSAVVTFSAMPASIVVGAALYDAISGGNLLFVGPYSYRRTVAAGTDLSVMVGDIVAVMH